MKDNTEIKNTAVEENVLYSLWLIGRGTSNSATAIDAIRKISRVTYSPANDLYMSKLPECVKTQMSKADAEKALKILQETGAKAEIKIAGENDDKKMAALIAKYTKPNCQSSKSNFKETFVAFLVAFAVVLLFFFGCDQQKIDSIDLDYTVKAMIEEQVKGAKVSECKLKKLPKDRFEGTVVIKRDGLSLQKVKVSGYLDDTRQLIVQIDDLNFLVCNHVLDVANENNISCQITDCILNENPDKTFTGTVTVRLSDGTFEIVKVKGNCNNNEVYVEIVQ